MFKATQHMSSTIGTGTHISLALKLVFAPEASQPCLSFPQLHWKLEAVPPRGCSVALGMSRMSRRGEYGALPAAQMESEKPGRTWAASYVPGSLASVRVSDVSGRTRWLLLLALHSPPGGLAMSVQAVSLMFGWGMATRFRVQGWSTWTRGG